MMTDTPTPEVEEKGGRCVLYQVGVVLLVFGFFGVLAWGFQAWFAEGMDATGDRVLCETVEMELSADGSEVWTCRAGADQVQTVVFSGSEDAVATVHDMAHELYQADLRMSWLYPSVGLVVVGLGLMVVGLRRELATD